MRFVLHFIFIMVLFLTSSAKAYEVLDSGKVIMGLGAVECEKYKNYFFLEDKNEGLIGCISCLVTDDISINPEECAKCSNREMIDGKCVLKECEENEFHDDEGECHGCSENVSIQTSVSECEKCENREINARGFCHIKETETSLRNIIRNPNKQTRMKICGQARQSEPCLFYILNNSSYDRRAESFFEEVASKTQRNTATIEKYNPLYQKMMVAPGYFVEIIVPAL